MQITPIDLDCDQFGQHIFLLILVVALGFKAHQILVTTICKSRHSMFYRPYLSAAQCIKRIHGCNQFIFSLLVCFLSEMRQNLLHQHARTPLIREFCPLTFILNSIFPQVYLILNIIICSLQSMRYLTFRESFVSLEISIAFLLQT